MEEFYNTTHESGEKLKEYKAKANSQSDQILKYFKKMQRPMTPSEVHMNLFDEFTPLTSVRRAMSNLTGHGKLEKTSDKQNGIYGHPEYKWKLKAKEKAEAEA